MPEQHTMRMHSPSQRVRLEIDHHPDTDPAALATEVSDMLGVAAAIYLPDKPTPAAPAPGRVLDITTPNGFATVSVRAWDAADRELAMRDLRELVTSLVQAYPELAPAVTA
ncbi:hypothetical protein [Nocardia cyriacigeorgica]|uniref:hypothetical protein n=1 Tax=Nocardia cyriacigeorgica TaxID=135487 RepID=UPI00189452CF|nr:hypothetical protein [Nocardia cyriacigeorgica]MBF6416922.1 hypothetical protein [Nocardia cyriacigeorgica]